MSKVDKAYLKQLVETPSVTGTETRIASVVRERLSEVADEIETNVMGSVQDVYKRQRKRSPRILCTKAGKR